MTHLNKEEFENMEMSASDDEEDVPNSILQQKMQINSRQGQ